MAITVASQTLIKAHRQVFVYINACMNYFKCSFIFAGDILPPTAVEIVLLLSKNT